MGEMIMGDVGNTIVALAEGWIGTPYRHQGAMKGVGCDCIGLIRGIWRELYGSEPEKSPAYAVDWAERSGEERLIAAGQRLFGASLAWDEARAGDLLLFRWRPDCAAKHAGILVSPSHFIHAYEQAAVTRSALVPSWQRRIAAVHRFPPRGLIENVGRSAYGAEVVSGAATPPTLDLSGEVYPDGHRPARPGHPQDKRNADRL